MLSSSLEIGLAAAKGSESRYEGKAVLAFAKEKQCGAGEPVTPKDDESRV